MDAVTNTLRADLSELRRTVVIGTTGSGKSTTAARLAAALSVPRVEMDAINWQADWIALTDTDVPLFRSRVAEAVRGDAWVVDGNYSVARDIVWPRATAVVWLNYPFGLIFSRLARRTLRRTLGHETLWAGNKERLTTHLFTRDSLFLWAFKSHWRRQRTLRKLFQEPEQAHLRLFRMRRASDTERWLTSVANAGASASEAAPR